MLTRSVSPALLPAALPGAAIALPGGGALDFGERLFASEPPLSPMCVDIPVPLTLRAHFLPLTESMHAAPLSAPKTPAHMLTVRLKPPCSDRICSCRPDGVGASLLSAASPFGNQLLRRQDPLHSSEPMCEANTQGPAPSSLSSLLSSPRHPMSCQHPQVSAALLRPPTSTELHVSSPNDMQSDCRTKLLHPLPLHASSMSHGKFKSHICPFAMQGCSLTSAHNVQYHADEQIATAAGHPAAGAAAAATQCGAAPAEAASDATLQSLLAGALASASAAVGPHGQQHGGQAHGHAAVPGGGGTVPWLPPGPLSSWHGFQGSAAAPLAGFLRPGAAGGLRPAEAVVNMLPSQDNCASGATTVSLLAPH